MIDKEIINNYQKNNVSTEDPQKVLVMLLDGTISFLNRAKLSINKDNFMKANENLIKAKNIITELLAAIDIKNGGEVGKNLQSLYWFLFEKIVEANLKKDPEIIEDIVPIIKTLKEGWENAKIDETNKNKFKNKSNGLNIQG